MTFMTGLFIVILAGMGLATISEIAKAIARRSASGSHLSEVRRQVEQQAAVIEELRAALSDQTVQVAELEERLDFAERLLTQARERAALEAGQERK